MLNEQGVLTDRVTIWLPKLGSAWVFTSGR